MESTGPNKVKEISLFILIMGIISSLLLLTNFSLIYIIGYGAIYTGIIFIFLIMLMLLKTHAKYLKREMNFLDTLLIGLPVFAISTIICFLIVDYDFKGTVVYSYYSNGYFLHILEETGKQFIPSTLIFVLIFAPLYRLIKKLKLNKESIEP